MAVDYDKDASLWSQDKPIHLSGLIARPIIYGWVRQSGTGKRLLDIGCGDGYPARVVANYVNRVIAFDISDGMLEKARGKERENPLGIEYTPGDLRDMGFIPDSSIDVAMANFSAHYLHPDELPKFYHDIARVLADNGQFMISVPHPSFLLAERLDETHKFDLSDFHYQRTRGKEYHGRLKTIIGTTLQVGGFHSKLEDHFKGISEAGLAVTDMREPSVTKEFAGKYPLYTSLEDEVLFMVFRGVKL